MPAGLSGSKRRQRSPQDAGVAARTRPRLEQSIRAKLWEKQHAVRVLRPAALTPHALAGLVLEMLAAEPKVTAPELDFGGLDRVVERFRALWPQETRDAVAVRL